MIRWMGKAEYNAIVENKGNDVPDTFLTRADG